MEQSNQASGIQNKGSMKLQSNIPLHSNNKGSHDKFGRYPSTDDIKIAPNIFVRLKKGLVKETYEVINEIGRGAFGKVFKVKHRKTNQIRAMKMLKKKSGNPEMFKEFQILKTLDHPNIISLNELYEDELYFFLISEYLSGGELFDRIKEKKKFSERGAANIMQQLLSAINYLNNNKIVHRDLKPENILFVDRTEDSPVKIIDFGVSEKFNSSTIFSEKQGTSYYIAPEVLKRSYNYKCDIWSLGVILFILLSGYPPFNGKTDKIILQKVKIGEFRFKASIWTKISKEAKDLIKLMLTYNPSERPNALETLRHIWFTSADNTTIEDHGLLERMEIFATKSKLQHAVYHFMILNSNDIINDKMIEYFNSLDKNKDGVLTKEELVEGVMKHKTYLTIEEANKEVDQIMAHNDSNLSGKMDFSEFILSTCKKEEFLSINRIKDCFNIFDIDQDEYISRDEFMEVMSGLDANEDQWNLLLKDFDKNEDQKISLDEFVNFLEMYKKQGSFN